MYNQEGDWCVINEYWFYVQPVGSKRGHQFERQLASNRHIFPYFASTPALRGSVWGADELLCLVFLCGYLTTLVRYVAYIVSVSSEDVWKGCTREWSCLECLTKPCIPFTIAFFRVEVWMRNLPTRRLRRGRTGFRFLAGEQRFFFSSVVRSGFHSASSSVGTGLSARG